MSTPESNTKQDEFNKAFLEFISHSLKAIESVDRFGYTTNPDYIDTSQLKMLFEKSKNKTMFVTMMGRIIPHYAVNFQCCSDDDKFLEKITKIDLFEDNTKINRERPHGIPLAAILKSAVTISELEKSCVDNTTEVSAVSKTLINLPINIKRELFRMLLIAAEDEYKKQVQLALDKYSAQLGIAKPTEAVGFGAIIEGAIDGIKTLPFIKPHHIAMLPDSKRIIEMGNNFASSKEAEQLTENLFKSVADGSIARTTSEFIQKTLTSDPHDPNLKQINEIVKPIMNYASGGARPVDQSVLDNAAKLEDE